MDEKKDSGCHRPGRPDQHEDDVERRPPQHDHQHPHEDREDVEEQDRRRRVPPGDANVTAVRGRGRADGCGCGGAHTPHCTGVTFVTGGAENRPAERRARRSAVAVGEFRRHPIAVFASSRSRSARGFSCRDVEGRPPIEGRLDGARIDDGADRLAHGVLPSARATASSTIRDARAPRPRWLPRRGIRPHEEARHRSFLRIGRGPLAGGCRRYATRGGARKGALTIVTGLPSHPPASLVTPRTLPPANRAPLGWDHRGTRRELIPQESPCRTTGIRPDSSASQASSPTCPTSSSRSSSPSPGPCRSSMGEGAAAIASWAASLPSSPLRRRDRQCCSAWPWSSSRRSRACAPPSPPAAESPKKAYVGPRREKFEKASLHRYGPRA